jgi:DNA-binding NtrC family response regulator
MALKLLIVQAESPFRTHLSERMRLENYLVFEASPESEAGDIVRRTNVDVVLLGPLGPHQSSLSLLKTIKEIRPYTEVILLTALEEHSLYGSIQAMRMGAFDDLLVPLDLSALRNRIQEAYARKKEKVRVRRSGTGGRQE